MNWLFIIFIFCLYYIFLIKCERVKLSCTQIQAFVDGHNICRQLVAQGAVPEQPAAVNMMYMVWDEELAEKAAKWAENGIFEHNPDRTVDSLRWSLIGENIYLSKFYSSLNTTVEPNIEEALNSWFNEHQSYGYEPIILEKIKPIGHYTQMVWADSTRVGCGVSQRRENGWTITLFVCDYGPTGNFIGQEPYKIGATAGYLKCVKGNCKKPYGKYC